MAVSASIFAANSPAEVASFEARWEAEQHQLVQRAQALEDGMRAKHLQEDVLQRRKR